MADDLTLCENPWERDIRDIERIGRSIRESAPVPVLPTTFLPTTFPVPAYPIYDPLRERLKTLVGMYHASPQIGESLWDSLTGDTVQRRTRDALAAVVDNEIDRNKVAIAERHVGLRVSRAHARVAETRAERAEDDTYFHRENAQVSLKQHQFDEGMHEKERTLSYEEKEFNFRAKKGEFEGALRKRDERIKKLEDMIGEERNAHKRMIEDEQKRHQSVSAQLHECIDGLEAGMKEQRKQYEGEMEKQRKQLQKTEIGYVEKLQHDAREHHAECAQIRKGYDTQIAEVEKRRREEIGTHEAEIGKLKACLADVKEKYDTQLSDQWTLIDDLLKNARPPQRLPCPFGGPSDAIEEYVDVKDGKITTYRRCTLSDIVHAKDPFKKYRDYFAKGVLFSPDGVQKFCSELETRGCPQSTVGHTPGYSRHHYSRFAHLIQRKPESVIVRDSSKDTYESACAFVCTPTIQQK